MTKLTPFSLLSPPSGAFDERALARALGGGALTLGELEAALHEDDAPRAGALLAHPFCDAAGDGSGVISLLAEYTPKRSTRRSSSGMKLRTLCRLRYPKRFAIAFARRPSRCARRATRRDAPAA